MHSLVRSRLEAARKELLDLGLRNPLINYRYPVSKGVEVAGEDALQVFDLLVNQSKAFTFSAAPEPRKGAGEPSAQVNQQDTKLQTSEPEVKLQQRLLNTYYGARTTLEEQGVNTLYLAFGMLHWYESNSSSVLRRAPLILVPVELQRNTAREKFRLTYTGEEIGANRSLEAKLKTEFGIALPDLEEGTEIDLAAYLAATAAAVHHMDRWQVAQNELVLGFFSFGKFLLYNDLDTACWPSNQDPAQHPLLVGLLGEGFQEPEPTIGEADFLDDRPEANEVLQAVDADATQLLAMLAVHEGRNLVIQGPPGTGKSQTITNIIANAIGHGKKVLFVAEKSAALEVVKRRLDALELGEACLELHSHKANKKELHAELRRTLELGKPALQHLQQQVALFAGQRQELNAYSKAVNTEIQQSGLTAHDVVGKLMQLAAATGQAELPKLHFAGMHSWNALRMQEAEAFASRIQSGLRNEPPVKYLFWGSTLQVLLPSQEVAIKAAVAAAQTAVIHLEQTAAAAASSTGLAIPQHREAAMMLAGALEVAAARPNLDGVNVLAAGWAREHARLAALVAAGKQLKAVKEQFANTLLPEAWQAEVLPLRAALLAHGNKWYRFLIGEYKTAKRKLAAYCTGTLPKSLVEQLALIDGVLEAQRLEQQLKDGLQLAEAYFGTAWQGTESDWSMLEGALQYLAALYDGIAAGRQPQELVIYIARREPIGATRSGHTALLQTLNEHGRAVHALTEQLAFKDELRFRGSTLLHQPFSEQNALLQSWKDASADLQQVIQFNNLMAIAERENLQPLTDLATWWPDAGTLLTAALQQTWYNHLLETALKTLPPLRHFEKASHEAVLESFRELDLRNLQYNRARAALKHWEGLPPATAGGQMQVLRNEFNKKARHLPIRRLMADAGLAIQAIKPVFMMSPLSIANFIPPGALEFDLVVFDEASQVRPVEALGALLRGQQLVVVGDSKQMPPTAFFDHSVQEEVEEESLTGNLPSILSLCDAQGATQRMLRWHYRSRHESLIRLSNHAFYDNRLVVFPAPGLRTGAGLVFHHLPNTTYDRGQTRTNQQEAEQVAAAVLEHARKHPRQSLGVVAFSTAQRDAIQDQLERLRRLQPELEQYLLQHPQEPFFIKNLENVQGDERDVIYISIGYGRTKDGHVSNSFGPVNMDGGEKRLNVLMTRARLRCEVFTNITSDDIDTSTSASEGLRVLKSFLHYAQKGNLGLQQPNRAAGAGPFADAVATQLLQRGYQVQRQVGASGYFLDLAIADPENHGRFILGVECDGANYHAARSARDRDRLRKQVLEAMGWKIHRIWSTDWYRNQQRAMEQLVQAIDAAWKDALNNDDEGVDEPLADTSLLREAQRQDAGQLPPYQLVQLPAEIGTAEMHLHPVGKVAKWVELVVRVEGPVHVDEVARRMVAAAGITRVGPRIREHLQLATRFAAGSGIIRQNGDFLYLTGAGQPPMRDRSVLSAASRKWKYVAPEERAAVLYKVVRDAVAIAPDDAYPLVTRLLGFARVTEDMRNEILGLVPAMEAAGLLIQENGMLKAEA